MPVTTLILTNLAIMLGVMVALWPISVWRKDPSYIDSVWPLGFIVMGVSTALLTNQSLTATSLVLGLTAIWGLRLGGHLFTRWLHEGPDKRYKVLKAKAKFNPDLFVLIYVFLMQGVLLWLVSLPIQHAIAEGPKPLGPMGLAGLALFVTGFAFETIADWQLTRFKADPANAGQVMDRGLWRYTRHPNYFGDACVFWGIWVISVADGTGWWTLIGPAFLTFTLVKWSGAALLEKGMRKTRPGYADYIARTSGFVPWFPKRD